MSFIGKLMEDRMKGRDEKYYFSFIIPVYNVERYLEKCVDSILNQDFNDYEIILIDDGSSDSSGKMCDRYQEKDPRVRTIHKKNGGLSDARNIGIKNARGEYIIFLDSDDFWNENMLGKLYEECKNEKIEILMFNYMGIDNSNMERIKNGMDFKNIESEIVDGETFLKTGLNFGSEYEWYAWLYIIKRELLLKNNLWFKKGIKYEDVDLIYRIILEAKEVKGINIPVINYRLNREGAITNSIKIDTEIDKLVVMESNIKYIQSLNIDEDLKLKLCNNISKLYYSALILLQDMKEINDKKILKNKLYDCRWVCKYSVDNVRKSIYCLIRIIGVVNTSKLLNIRRRIKGKND